MNIWRDRLTAWDQTMKKTPYRAIFNVLPVFFLSILLAIRIFLTANHYAVNLVFLDQFDYMRPIFDHMNLWDLFDWQHGPHRQGLGGLVSKLLADGSGINTRAEAFAIVGFLCLSLVLVLILKRLLLGRFQWIDILFPMAVLTLQQYEIFIITPNLALASVPLFLVFLYAVSWLVPNQMLKYAAVTVTNFLLVFTGFGIFMEAITIFILIVEITVSFRKKQYGQTGASSIALVFAALSAALFLWHYKFVPAVDCFGFSLKYTVRYPAYISLLDAEYFGMLISDNLYAALGFGLVVEAATVVTMVKHGWEYLRNPFQSDPTSKIIFLLTGFSLLFAVFTAVGRVCLGLGSAQSSRYVTLLIPGIVGMLLSLYKMKRSRRTFALFALATILLAKTLLPLPQVEQTRIAYFHDGKTAWKECYLKLENVKECNQRTNFQIYPDENSKNVLSRLEYFKQEHLNLYLDSQ